MMVFRDLPLWPAEQSHDIFSHASLFRRFGTKEVRGCFEITLQCRLYILVAKIKIEGEEWPTDKAKQLS